jgi:hypothetical protein
MDGLIRGSMERLIIASIDEPTRASIDGLKKESMDAFIHGYPIASHPVMWKRKWKWKRKRKCRKC